MHDSSGHVSWERLYFDWEADVGSGCASCSIPRSTSGVRAWHARGVLGIDDADFLKRLEGHRQLERRAGKDRDCIIWGAKDKKDLAKLPSLEQAIDRAGGIWVIWPKGKPELKEDDIRAAAIAAGLVDVKVLKFSETHSGLRLVIPKARR